MSVTVKTLGIMLIYGLLNRCFESNSVKYNVPNISITCRLAFAPLRMGRERLQKLDANRCHEPTPSPLPGGEPATGASDEAPLLGGAGGGFMERENLQNLDVNRGHEPIHWWGETPSSPDVLIGKNVRVRRLPARRLQLGESLTPPRFMERVDFAEPGNTRLTIAQPTAVTRIQLRSLR